MSSYRIPTKKDWQRVALYILLAIAVIIISAIVLIPMNGQIGFILWLVIVTGSLFLLVRWHAKNTVYRCQSCGKEFEISVFTDFISPQSLDKKYLKCPCGKREWATILIKED